MRAGGSSSSVTERSPILGSVNTESSHGHSAERSAIGFMGALQIPGVVEFSLCLFFSKLVSYTFLYWLPLYIQSSSKLYHVTFTLISST